MKTCLNACLLEICMQHFTSNNDPKRIYKKCSAGTSLQNMIHYAQMVQSAELQKYDFKNDETNSNRYMSPTPPKIDLTKIRTPVIVYYGTEDDLSTVDDVEWTLGKPFRYLDRVQL